MIAQNKKNLGDPGTVRRLLKTLEARGYVWSPLTPERLLEARERPESHGAFERLLGLGEEVEGRALVSEGLSEELLRELLRNGFLIPEAGREGRFRSQFAVCGSGDLFILHDHWPPRHGEEGEYVHAGHESATLSRILQAELEGFIGKKVLDLGCSSGMLAFELAGVAETVHGLDISARAVQIARFMAEVYGFGNLVFSRSAIGEPSALETVGRDGWDAAVANPPMAISERGAPCPHRDGGEFGLEIPLKFLDFAARALKVSGEFHALCTNPIVNGRPRLFEELSKRPEWDILRKKRIHSHFNQSVARKQGYADQGIARIELWYLHLRRAGARSLSALSARPRRAPVFPKV